MLAKSGLKEKPKLNQIPDKKFVDLILGNQISYYKINISLPKGFSGSKEFYIEAVGSEGGYGLLDPTILTENFNTYSDGDLNGQGNWVADVDYDIQGTTTYEGAKGVKIIESGDWSSAYATGTQLASGTLATYFYLSATSTSKIQIQLLNEADVSIGRFYFGYVAGQTHYQYTAGSIQTSQYGTYTSNVWYRVDFEWQSSPSHQIRFTVDNNTSTSWVSPENDWTTGPDTVRFYAAYSNVNPIYLDYIAETAFATGTVAIKPQMRIMIID